MQLLTLSSTALLLLLVKTSHCQSGGWDLTKFSTLIAFGDSYSDDSRLHYFKNNGGRAPPAGWDNPVVSSFAILKGVSLSDAP
jgi:phospholipase/lecithinase/hemolysin